MWGIDNNSHDIVGTSFKPRKEKINNQELESWLLTQLDPRIEVRIHEGEVDGKQIVLFEIQPSTNRPVRFKGIEYIRIGSYKKKLHEFPEKERQLWRVFDRQSFEMGVAKENANADEVLSLLDYPGYFQLMQQSLPENRVAILQRLTSDGVITPFSGGRYNISNVGAILFARNLEDFSRLTRKALRVIIYRGENRVETIKEHKGGKGYAIGFKDIIDYINDHLPQNEQIGEAFRREVRMYPEIAVRELVANALIHQDFSITGCGPMVEIFTNRIEMSNPGIPLIDPLRFLDEPPRSRNEKLAALMRRMNICEERGSGIDKIIFQVELYQLPPPDFRETSGSTIAVLYGPEKFTQMGKDQKIRACYQHACLQHVSNKLLTNSSLRKRLGIEQSNYPIASKIIRDTANAKLVKPYSENLGSRKDAKYVPFWA